MRTLSVVETELYQSLHANGHLKIVSDATHIALRFSLSQVIHIYKRGYKVKDIQNKIWKGN